MAPHKTTEGFTAADIERHYQGTVFDWLKWYEEQVASLRRAVEGSRGDPNDFFAILHPAQEFICQWLKEKMPPPQQVDTKLDKEAFASRVDDEYHRALVALLRSDMPLDNGLRHSIADDLEYFYFPTHARVIARNMRRRLTEASAKFSQIEFLMDPEKLDREFALTMHRKHVPKRPPLSGSEAKRRVAEESDKSTGALGKDLTRAQHDWRRVEDLMRERGISAREAMELLASKEAEEEEETGFDSWEQEEASQSTVFSRQKTTPAKK